MIADPATVVVVGGSACPARDVAVPPPLDSQAAEASPAPSRTATTTPITPTAGRRRTHHRHESRRSEDQRARRGDTGQPAAEARLAVSCRTKVLPWQLLLGSLIIFAGSV